MVSLPKSGTFGLFKQEKIEMEALIMGGEFRERDKEQEIT